MKGKEWPEKDELVVCTVKEVKHFGAFVNLDEYENKEGLIHISEIATGWVKHIRDYVRERQKVVCKVLDVNEPKGHIDLSLKTVKVAQKREKIKWWKNEQKAEKWLSFLADANAGIMKEELDEIEMKLVSAYGGLYEAFEDVVRRGMEALHALGIEEEYAREIYEVAITNVKLPSVRITGYVELACPMPEGVEIIKDALKKAKEVKVGYILAEEGDGVDVEILYMGAPRYQIGINAADYKSAESVLSAAANVAIEEVKREGGEGRFYRKTFS
jgi:translation initiation factor 2 subunit 1